MMLPLIIPEKQLHFTHFPAAYQCVIFRNWGMVPAERIASVIGASVQQVHEEAHALGLPKSDGNETAWLSKGYITIIRQNWQLLSYADLCVLLDWTEEKLAFILREDDFLDVKLGNFKPATPDCHIRPLTSAEQIRTAEIRRITEECYAKLPVERVRPFDFEPYFDLGDWKAEPISTPRFEERYLYSYCALYGDVFVDRALLDASFPDALLSAYRDMGITGVWTHVVLYTVVEYPFDKKLSEGYEQRQAGIRYLTEKLARYGLKLFLYFNEPRAMPDAFFDNCPELKGHSMDGYSSLCVNTPQVADYLRNGVEELCRAVPQLGGFFTITASENLTNCRSHAHGDNCACPRCRDLSPADVYAKVNNLVAEGVARADSKAKIIAWTWGWPEEQFDECITKTPTSAAIMNVSEQAVQKEICGTLTRVLDYSISVEGPGALAQFAWERAVATGHKAYAKMQFNNSWEMAAVPYIPVFERFYRHIDKIAQCGLNGMMLCWTLGGCPSPVLKMLSMFYDSDREKPSLEAVYEKLYPGCEIEVIKAAVHEFSEAFDAYPFYLDTIYFGPHSVAPANLLWKKPTGFSASMVCYPYDDLDGWCSIFPVDVYLKQIRRLSEGWAKGLALLENATDSNTKEFQSLLRTARLCGCHFRSMVLQAEYIMKRNSGENLSHILTEEAEHAMEAAKLLAVDPTLAYESTNHYFYTIRSLIEKVISLNFIG